MAAQPCGRRPQGAVGRPRPSRGWPRSDAGGMRQVQQADVSCDCPLCGGGVCSDYSNDCAAPGGPIFFNLTGSSRFSGRGSPTQPNPTGTFLLLLVLTARRDPERVLGVTPTHLYGSAPVPHPPLPAPEAGDRVHSFLRTQEVKPVTGVHLLRLPPASADNTRGIGSCCTTCGPRGSPASRLSADGRPPTPAHSGPTPPPAPPPLPPSPRTALHSTAGGTPLMH